MSMNYDSDSEKAGLLVFLFMACISLAAVLGFIMNIVKFAKCDFDAPYKAEIIRGVGIPCAPMGAVIGYFHINDGKVVEIAE